MRIIAFSRPVRSPGFWPGARTWPASGSCRDCSHLAARLRRRTLVQEAEIAQWAILRQDELDPAAHCKAKVGFPEAAVEGVSDEQNVRNVAGVLDRSSV